MPSPAKKKRKTNRAAAKGTRRATRSQKPTLSIEMIGKVASFAQYGDDLMNICKAVGRKDSAVVRHACLRNNMKYLRRTLQYYVEDWNTIDRRRLEIFSWMKVNTDWCKHCTAARANGELASASSDGDGEANVEQWDGFEVRRVPSDQRSYDSNPLLLFNNPTLAIEIGLVDVLKYLVEVICIDVNAYLWNGYLSSEKFHLLATAIRNDKACFDYLLSRDELDVCNSALSMDTARNLFGGDMADIGSRSQLWQFAIADMQICTSSSFERLVRHQSFDPNKSVEINGGLFIPLLHAFTTFTSWELDRLYGNENSTEDLSDMKIAKFKALLDAGADPTLDLGQELGDGTPIEAASLWVEDMAERNDSKGVHLGEQMIELMRENIASRNL